MEDAPIYYMIRSWVSPEGRDTYFKWIDKKHLTEMQSIPGVLWSRKINLEQVDDKGWESILLIHGFDGRESLSRYLDSPVRNKFWKEVSEFKGVHRSERFYGKVVLSLDE